VSLSGGIGHIHEWTFGGQFLDLEDPWYAASTVAYAVLQTAYQGTGTWTHTYWTN
jgi:hypothetical protein